MKFFLDFDGVLFNTQILKDKMLKLGIDEFIRSASLFEEMKETDPQFEIGSLMYDDARRFLTEHAQDCRVVSSYVSSNPANNQDEHIQREYQLTKIQLCGVAEMVGEEHVHVVGLSKREALSALKKECDENKEDCVFVDDRLVYVEEARSLGMLSVWMNRAHLPSQPQEMHQVGSFDELIEKIEIWKK